MIPPFLSLFGLASFFVLLRYCAPSNFQIRGVGLNVIRELFNTYAPFALVFILVIIFGRLIPYSYNFFVERSYNLTLYKSVEDNADLVNQVRFVKEQKIRASSYYAILYGVSLGITFCIWDFFLSEGTILSWMVFLLVLCITLVFVPLIYAYNEMVLFYPVIECMKRKRVAIDIYNADKRGGLKYFHRFLFKVVLFNEGVALILIGVFKQLPISKAWMLLLIPILLPRLNHAVWAILCWLRSIYDFHLMKNAEKKLLVISAGTPNNLEKMESLKKIHATGIIPVICYLLGFVLVPYLINQLPQLNVLLNYWGIVK